MKYKDVTWRLNNPVSHFHLNTKCALKATYAEGVQCIIPVTESSVTPPLRSASMPSKFQLPPLDSE